MQISCPATSEMKTVLPRLNGFLSSAVTPDLKVEKQPHPWHPRIEMYFSTELFYFTRIWMVSSCSLVFSFVCVCVFVTMEEKSSLFLCLYICQMTGTAVSVSLNL